MQFEPSPKLEYEVVGEFWSISIPTGWIDTTSEQGTLKFESPTGDKAILLTPLRQSIAQMNINIEIMTIQNFELDMLKSMEQCSWDIIKKDRNSSNNFATGLIDCFDKNLNLRIAAKSIANRNYAIKARFYDYDCKNYELSKTYFESIIESLVFKNSSEKSLSPVQNQQAQAQHQNNNPITDNFSKTQNDIKLGKAFLLTAMISWGISLIALVTQTPILGLLNIVGVVSGIIGFYKIHKAIKLSNFDILIFCVTLLLIPFNIIYYWVVFSKASTALTKIGENKKNLAQHNVQLPPPLPQNNIPKPPPLPNAQSKPSIQTVLPYLKIAMSADQWNNESEIRLSNFEDDAQLVHQILHGGFVIFYVLDTGDNLSYINKSQLKESGLSLTELHKLAVNNLLAWTQDSSAERPLQVIQSNDKTHVRLQLDHNFDATVMILDYVWNHIELRASTPNGIVAAIPARNVLLYCDAKSTQGIEALQKAIEKAQVESHVITNQLFIRKDHKWEPLKDEELYSIPFEQPKQFNQFVLPIIFQIREGSK